MDDADFDSNLHFRESTLGERGDDILMAIRDAINDYWHDPAPIDDGGMSADEAVNRIADILKERAGIVCGEVEQAAGGQDQGDDGQQDQPPTNPQPQVGQPPTGKSDLILKLEKLGLNLKDFERV